jgi:hypothetical protein
MLPVFYIGLFNHPCPADDFVNAEWKSFTGVLWDLYMHWSGRYFNNLTASLCPLHWHSMGAYRAVVIIIMLAFALGFILLLLRILTAFTDASFGHRLAISSAFTALLFNNFPSLAQGFFWYTSEVTYVLPSIAVFGLLAILMRVDTGDLSTQMLIVAAALAAIAIGSNEILLMLTDLIVAFAFFYYRLSQKREQQTFYKRLLIICALCTAAALLAPGNFARQAVLQRGSLSMVLPTWLYTSQKTFFQWLTDPYLLCCSVLALLLLNNSRLRLPRMHLLLAFALPFALVVLLTLPAHYALGTVPPPRVMNVVLTFYLLAWLHFLMQALHSLRLAMATAETTAQFWRQVLAVIVILGLLGSANSHDLRRGSLFAVPKSLAKGIPQAYDAELRARYSHLDTRTSDTVHIAPLRAVDGNPLFLVDILAQPTETAKQYARYWGAQVVVLDTAQKGY